MFNESLSRKWNARWAILFYNGIIKYLKLYIVIARYSYLRIKVAAFIFFLFMCVALLYSEHYKNKYHVCDVRIVFVRLDDPPPKTLIQYSTLSFHVDAGHHGDPFCSLRIKPPVPFCPWHEWNSSSRNATGFICPQ